jgi:hypothetical protein
MVLMMRMGLQPRVSGGHYGANIPYPADHLSDSREVMVLCLHPQSCDTAPPEHTGEGKQT